jgi:hypothetical protein
MRQQTVAMKRNTAASMRQDGFTRVGVQAMESRMARQRRRRIYETRIARHDHARERRRVVVRGWESEEGHGLKCCQVETEDENQFKSSNES